MAIEYPLQMQNGNLIDIAVKIVESAWEPLVVLDRDLRVIKANDAFYRTFQVSREETEMRYIYDLGNGQWHIPELRRLLEDIFPKQSMLGAYEIDHEFQKIGHKRMQIKARRLDSENLILLAIDDVTDWRAIQALQADQNRVLEMLARGKDLSEVLVSCVEMIGRQCNDVIGSILLVDDDGARLVHAVAPGLPSEVIKAIDGIKVGPDTGACGPAAFFGKPVIVENVQLDPLCVMFRDLARRHRLEAVWSYPIFSKDRKVLGTFAIYRHAPGRPGSAEARLLESAANLAGLAIETYNADRALRESEQRYRNLVENSPEAILIYRNERIVFVNSAGLRLYGASEPKQLLGHFYHDFTHPEYHALVTQRIESVLKGGSAPLIEKKILKLDGQTCEVEAVSSIYVDRKGPAVQVMLRDVSERKRAEDERRQLTERLNSHVANSPLGVIEFDSEFRIIQWNSEAEHIFGWSREEVIGKTSGEFRWIYEEDRSAAQQVIEEMRTGVTCKSVGHNRNYRKDGSVIHCEWYNSALTNKGQFMSALCQVLDVTARVRAEEIQAKYVAAERMRLAESEAAERRAVFLAEASSSLSSSLDYWETLAIVARLAVPRFSEMCNVDILEDDKWIRRVAMEHANAEKLDIELKLEHSYPTQLSDAFSGGAVLRSGKTEWRAKKSDAQLIAMAKDQEHLDLLRKRDLRSYICVPMRARGRVLGAITFGITESDKQYTHNDVTLAEDLAQRAAFAVDNARLYRETQQALFVAQKAVNSRDELLAIVSHDLKSPLNAIGLSAEYLAEAVLQDGKQQKAVATIKHAKEKMHRLIEDLLDIASIDTGTLSIKKQRCEVYSLVEQVVEIQERAASAKGITLKSELDPALPAIDVDATRILQVLGNLIGNGIKFTPQGGVVTIQARENGETVKFCISDTGPGIPEDQFEHIFDRYWKANDTAHLGTGLGLAIAKGIVESHGGHIFAKSEHRKGAEFQFTVPVHH